VANDFHFNKEIKKGTDLNDPNSPHLLKFEDMIPHVGEFQSMEMGILRDGKRKHTIGLYSFHLEPKGKSTLLRARRYSTLQNVKPTGVVFIVAVLYW